MKTIITSAFLILMIGYVKGQDKNPIKKDTTFIGNQLLAPDSPGSNLLGIAASEIQKPTDVSSFVAQLQNATNTFSRIPASFALDYAPWARNKVTSAKNPNYNTNGLFSTFVISLGVKSSSDEKYEKDSTQLGIGMKISLIHRKFNQTTGNQLKKLDSQYVNLQQIALKVRDIQRSVNKELDGDLVFNTLSQKFIALSTPGLKMSKQDSINYELLRNDMGLIRERKTDSLRSENKALHQSVLQLTKQAVDHLNQLKFRKYGPYLDLAAGLAFDFPGNVFSKGSIYRQAVWLNGGYESKCGFSFLGLLRYQYNPDKVFADEKKVLKTTNVNTLDFGGKLYYSQEKTRFSVSGEFVYRSVLDKSEIKPTYRLALNTTYELQDNTLLTLSLGRDFDKTIHKDGNVIAALNLIKGFGNKRTLSR